MGGLNETKTESRPCSTARGTLWDYHTETITVLFHIEVLRANAHMYDMDHVRLSSGSTETGAGTFKEYDRPSLWRLVYVHSNYCTTGGDSNWWFPYWWSFGASRPAACEELKVRTLHRGRYWRSVYQSTRRCIPQYLNLNQGRFFFRVMALLDRLTVICDWTSGLWNNDSSVVLWR